VLTAQRPRKRAVKRKANARSISGYVLPAPSLACGVGFWAAAETRARGLRQQQIQAPISMASRRSRSIAALLQGIAPAWHIAWAVLGVAASPLVQAAAFTVGAGGAAYHGTIDLACDDLEVNGPLDASGALFTGVGRVRISAADSIAAAGARIELGAGWHNAAGPAGFPSPGSTVAAGGRLWVCFVGRGKKGEGRGGGRGGSGGVLEPQLFLLPFLAALQTSPGTPHLSI